MSDSVKIEFEGLVEYNRKFDRLNEVLADLRPIWPPAVEAMRQAEREQFAGEGVGPSGRWAALSRSYAKQKAKTYPGRQINQRTRRLVEALTDVTSDTVIEMEPDTLTYSTKVPYQKYVNKKRKLMDLNSRQKARITRAMNRALLFEAQKIGFEVRT